MQIPPETHQLISLLGAMRDRVAALQLSPVFDWKWQPSEGEWSLTEVLCHLRDVEIEVHLARINAFLTQIDPFVPGVSADEWAAIRNYQSQDGHQAFVDYLAARQKTIDALKPLEPADWQKQGNHAFFGITTLEEIVFLAVRHDDIHWQQIRDIISSQPNSA